jgi:hypothetical protein
MNRRWRQFSPGWLVVIFILTMLGVQNISFFGVLLLIGILWFARNAIEDEQARRDDVIVQPRRQVRPSSRRSPVYEDLLPPSRQPQDPAISSALRAAELGAQPHALEAVRAAAQNPASLPVLPVDIGVLAYRADDEPVIHRDWAVMDDVDYIQPFVQLRLPRAATGRVRFELIDSAGERQFVHEQDYQLERGRNLVVPAARLPIHDNYTMEAQWELRVSADGVLLAVHNFGWEDSSKVTAEMQRHILEDGEISNELRAALAESKLERMSLDELLGDQQPGEGDATHSADHTPGPRRISRQG